MDVNLPEVIGIGVARVQRHFQKLTAQLDMSRGFNLSDQQAKSVIYDGFILRGIDAPKHLTKATHDAYFNPLNKNLNLALFAEPP